MEKLFYIACTLALTVYGQLIMKSRAIAHASDNTSGSKLNYLLSMYTDIGVLSGLGAAVLASICWALALEKAGLGFAYPFMALSFVIVPLLARTLFGEPMSPMQIAGIVTIVAGVAINALAYNG
jgi:drug/metabolite transporter (DMT)-like permease